MVIQRGANVNAQNSQGETPMHGAALKNHHVMIERLIEAGALVRRRLRRSERSGWKKKSRRLGFAFLLQIAFVLDQGPGAPGGDHLPQRSPFQQPSPLFLRN